MVDVGLRQHRVVLELGLSERRSVASNDDELGLSGAKGLEGRLVSKSDYGPLLTTRSKFRRGSNSYLYQTSSQARDAS